MKHHSTTQISTQNATGEWAHTEQVFPQLPRVGEFIVASQTEGAPRLATVREIVHAPGGTTLFCRDAAPASGPGFRKFIEGRMPSHDNETAEELDARLDAFIAETTELAKRAGMA